MRSRPLSRPSSHYAQLHNALELQRKAQWRLDFVAAENSMGFHAPQEAAPSWVKPPTMSARARWLRLGL